MIWEPLFLSIKLGFFTLPFLILFSLPVAWVISRSPKKIKPFLQSLLLTPLILPPVVLGFYLLILLSPKSFLGSIAMKMDVRLVFTFTGLVIASFVSAFPIMLKPLVAAMDEIDERLIYFCKSLGKSNLSIFLKVVIPGIKKHILSSAMLCFSHILGQFGVVLMIGGSIPKETRVASIALYEAVELLDYNTAHQFSAIMITMGFIILVAIHWLENHA